MKKAKTEIDYNLFYNNNFDKVYTEYSNTTMKLFRDDNGKTLLFKKNELLREYCERKNNLTYVKIGEGPSGNKDEYTERLFLEWRSHKGDYTKNHVTNFINEYFYRLKSEFKKTKHVIPDNYKSNAQKTVELLAKNDVLNDFIKKLEQIDGDDTEEIWVKKLGKKKYEEPPLYQVLESNDKIEWLGTQKQLGELIVELFKKGWIKVIVPDLIRSSFTKSDTIEQVLKPGVLNKAKNEYPYENIYKKKYSKKFDGIKVKKANMKIK